jgi:uncharacterized protein (TIGR03118 family)
MDRLTMPSRRRAGRIAVLAVALVALGVPAAARAETNSYMQRNLVSDIPGLAKLHDALLVNPWGLAAGPTTPLWVANNGTDTATIYPGDANGVPVSRAPLVVHIPSAEPTGQVFNDTTGFLMHVGGTDVRATFIFDTQAGDVAAWAFTDPVRTHARVVAHVDGAAFTGLTLGRVSGRGPLLYAADFPNHRILVFNDSFRLTSVRGGFEDPMVPSDWGPFDVQSIGGRIFVAFAKVSGGDEVKGPHLGIVDIFNRRGMLLRRFVSGGALNAPWGMTQAPATGFGPFSGDVLIGNFGNGLINAYDPVSGEWQGALRRPDGSLLRNDGLWGLRFGNGVTGGRHALLFSAGIDDEAHGLVGAIRFSG